MKLIKPSTKIVTPINGEEILRDVEEAARMCYQSEGKIEYQQYVDFVGNAITSNLVDGASFTCISARPLITKLISMGHEAMLEFGGMITVKFIVDRGVSHELVRHRMASFAQECLTGDTVIKLSSNKTITIKDEHITFIIPEWTYLDEGIYDSNHDDNNILVDDKTTDLVLSAYTWIDSMAIAEVHYNRLLECHWTPQEARAVLPNSIKTEIIMSANLREWRHIFKLRTSKAAHPQMREVMIPLLAEFQEIIPIIFDDIII